MMELIKRESSGKLYLCKMAVSFKENGTYILTSEMVKAYKSGLMVPDLMANGRKIKRRVMGDLFRIQLI